MIIVCFLLLAPFYRIFLFTYRYFRLKRLKKIYTNWLFNNDLKDSQGNRISIYSLSYEINYLFKASYCNNFNFIESKDDKNIKSTAKAFEKSLGYFKTEIFRSFLPHTYLLMLINLPLSISKKVDISPKKSILFFTYILLVCLGFIDINSFVDKLVNFLF